MERGRGSINILSLYSVKCFLWTRNEFIFILNYFYMFKKFNIFILDLFPTLLTIIIIYVCLLNENYILALWFILLKLFNSEIFIKSFHTQLTPHLSTICEFYNYLFINRYLIIVLWTSLFFVLILFNLRGLIIFTILISYPIIFFRKLETFNYPTAELVKFTLKHIPPDATRPIVVVVLIGGSVVYYNMLQKHKLESSKLLADVLRDNADMYCRINVNSSECKASKLLLQEFTKTAFNLTGNKFPNTIKEPTIGDIIINKESYNITDDQVKALTEIQKGVLDSDLAKMAEIMKIISE
uniref:hypothetical protein n=1 Tax=Conidiobolus taihushanensis TaxID=2721185 RepID=UPI001D112988|nr:hypothetical protein LK112_mgp18 [Conidiobolus taihushanensis]QZZ81393.1 hypothetical protein [Conidiobolus taihushanensis]